MNGSIERILEDNGANPHLQALVAAGSARDELLIALQLAFLADESWEKQVGMKLRDFKRTIANIRDFADTIDRLNKSELIYRASIEHRIPGFAGLRDSPTLAERLREYATKLDWLRRVFGPKRGLRLHVWKAWIVAIVTEDTKKPHDIEVSTLVAAVLDDPKYSLEAHKAWRRKHLHHVAMMRKIVQNQRIKRILISHPGISG